MPVLSYDVDCKCNVKDAKMTLYHPGGDGAAPASTPVLGINSLKTNTHKFSERDIHSWPMDPSMCVALAHGMIPNDYTDVYQGSKRYVFLFPLKKSLVPPHSLLKNHFQERGLTRAGSSMLSAAAKLPCKGYGGVRQYRWNPEINVKAAKVYVNSRSRRSMNLVRKDAADLDKMIEGAPGAIGEVVDDDAQATQDTSMAHAHQAPSHIPRVDVAAMRAHRRWYRRKGPFRRYKFIDASPQANQSIEVMNTSELIIPVRAFLGHTLESLPMHEIMRNRFPTVGLGQGCCDAANKSDSVLHQDWLLYGPSEKDMRGALADVRQVLSDLGVEAKCNDFFDILNWYLNDHDVSKITTTDQHSFLYPNSLRTPGVLHILDWLVRETLAPLSFFPSFLKNLKLILQYLHSQNHKEYLRKKATEQHEDADDPELGIATACEPLDHQVERFANWRWRTIMKANDDLERHISLLVCVATGLPPSKWSLKEGAPLKAISELVDNEAKERGKCAAIRYCIRRLISLDGWIRGCPCHGDERKKSQPMAETCMKSGWRAPYFADKVRETLVGIEADIKALTPGQFGDAVDVNEVHSALTRLLGRLEFKFLSWLEDLPYLIWQANVCRR